MKAAVRSILTGWMWLTVAAVVVSLLPTLSVGITAQVSRSGASSQALRSLLVEDGHNGFGLDEVPHFRYADKNVDATLLDDLTNILIQTQARAVREHCKLLGNWFGYVIQLTLGAVAFGALIVKKFTDKKTRDWMTWFRDTSKQGIGAIVAHMWNLLFATLLQSHEEEDPCVYYLVNYLVDALPGCVLALLLLWAFEAMAEKYNWDMLRSGDYGSGLVVVWQRWAAQCALWIAIVTLSKLVLLFCLIIPAKQPLYVAGQWMMSGLVNYPRLELVIVMIIIPLVFNVITFWVVDNFLMNNDETHTPLDESDLKKAAAMANGTANPNPNPDGTANPAPPAPIPAAAPNATDAGSAANVTITVAGSTGAVGAAGH